MSYILIEEGILTTTLAFGILLGIMLACVLFYLIQKYYIVMFRQYVREIDDKDRNEILNTLEDIRENFESLAKRTNTTVMKSESNYMVNLIASLHQRRIN